jgi:2-amino-4-hydroxy-6-hydroxymethyldihydropteridine diphosphokinase
MGWSSTRECTAAALEKSCRRFFVPTAVPALILMTTTLIALGANLGDRQGNLQRALALLDRTPGLRVSAHSRWFSTAPIGGPAGQAEFVNAAARLETTLSPLQTLAVLHDVEAELGRQRRHRWAARCLDLDLLLFGDVVLKTPDLELPHPRMAFRRFVLEPAAEVAADLIHPVIGWTIGQLLSHLNSAPNYLAITGVPGVGKTELARNVAAVTAIRFVADSDARLPAPDDAPDQPLAAELARWRRRAELLARQNWTAESPVVISDFWLGQSLAYSRLWPDEHQRAEFAAACQLDAISADGPRTAEGASLRPVKPKLLVLLDAPQVPERWASVRAELRQLVFQRGTGPMLELDASRSDAALVELRAAVEAMQ